MNEQLLLQDAADFLLGCYYAKGFIIPNAGAGFVLSEQITLLDLPVGKRGLLLPTPLLFRPLSNKARAELESSTNE